MKNIYSFLALCLLGYTLSAQTTRRVNCDPKITGVNVYNTIQAAVDAANADDVILLEQSCTPSTFGNVTISKRLHLKGNGYVRNFNDISIRPSFEAAEALGTVTLEFGSSGSSFSSLQFTALEVFDSGISIKNCVAGDILFQNSFDGSSNVQSEGNNAQIISSVISTVRDFRYGTSSFSNTLISNCILFMSTGGAALTNLSNIVARNNIFWHNASNGQTMQGVTNSIFENNVFRTLGLGIEGSGSQSNSFNHNINVNGNHLPNSNGNINNAVATDVFVGPTFPQYSVVNYLITEENAYKLSVGSLAIGAGTGGSDIGPWDGEFPYQVSGLPNTPINTNFSNTSFGNNTTNISATATFKAN
jgi:hypothetical protein